jgi:hypothetical protein
MDDLAALKRVSRVEGYHLMDVRRLIKSGNTTEHATYR